MSKIGILEADPTRFGGIQAFCRTLSGYLPADQTELLAYYGDLAYEKELQCKLVNLNDRLNRSAASRIFGSRKDIYKSQSPWKRNFALLQDIPFIRRNMEKRYPGGDTIVINSASALLLFLTKKVLKNNRIILVQHNDPEVMYKRSFDFGGFFRKCKIRLFEKYVDTFVLLSDNMQEKFAEYLPLKDKKIEVIRHAVDFPVNLPHNYPAAVAVLARLIRIKRVDRVIACARLLPEVTFNIYGTGPEEDALKNTAVDLENVVFHGYTSDINNVFQNNSILVIASEYEGYPISGIECCVHGRGLIVVNTFSAAVDLVNHNENGILLQEYTPEGMAVAIKTILSSPVKYQQGALRHRELYNCKTAAASWRQLLCKGK